MKSSSNAFSGATLVVVVTVILGAASSAQAIPAFARKFNVPCQTCHLAPPYLNATGRKFLEAGYRMPDEDGVIDEAMQNHQTINDNLVLEKMVPFALHLTSVPVTATTGEQTQSQPLASFNLVAFGNFYKYGSFHFALGAAAEDGFAPAGDGRLGIHPSPYLNVLAGFGSPFAPDPYNTFRTEDTGLTRLAKATLVDGHDSLTALADDVQYLEGYGRAGPVYYAVGLLGSSGLATGELPETGMARVALDPFDGLSLGAFGVAGKRQGGDAAGGPPQPATFWRTGADVNGTIADLTGVAAFVAAGDQLDRGAQKTNLGGFLEGIYAVRVDGRPIFMPVARIDWQQDDDVNNVTGSLDLSSYVFENCRVGVDGSYATALNTTGAAVLSASVFADVIF